MKKILYLLIAIGLYSHIGCAREFDKSKLDMYFDALETNDRFMGSVAVSKDGIIIYTRSLGYIDLENGIKADANSKYRVGSVSKTFTTVLILKGVEKGLIDLDQTIDVYFPTINNADKITINHLLYHRSGIHNFTDDEAYLTWRTEEKTEEEMVEIIEEAGIDFEPDSKAAYSNSNYVLLTYILEKVFQQSYQDLLGEYITNPIGLENTYLGGKINTENKESKSYRYFDKWVLEPETDVSIPLGAGGIVSTPTDLVKFSDALFGGKLIEKESLDKMTTMKDNFGRGLFVIPFYGNTGYGHTGGLDGFSSVFCHFPEGNLSYALTSNGTNFNNNDISIAVLSAVYGKSYDIPEFTTFNVNSEDLDKYLGVYSSQDIPIKITITKVENVLWAQGTGQPSFPLEAVQEHQFKYDAAGVVLEFNPEENAMTLKQQGMIFLFNKQ